MKIVRTQKLLFSQLGARYWVAVYGDAVRIHRFKGKKPDKKTKPGLAPSMIKHGW